MRTYSVLLMNDMWHVIFQDDFESEWYVYIPNLSESDAKEVAGAMNRDQNRD